MKIIKHYLFIAFALITMISFTGCQDKDEIIYNLTDCEWEGYMFVDQFGDDILSTFTFAEDGYGIERQRFADDFHSSFTFKWRISRSGELELYYPKKDIMIYIHSYYVGEYNFSGEYQIEDGPSNHFELKAVW